ncbi:MAG TPA: PBP1A family penicillin-binding protein [Polyangia bacterium]|nr:PBP1A family penicillin-binding protein [Polyangia bacterium]
MGTVTSARRAGSRPGLMRVLRLAGTLAVLALFAGVALVVGIFSYYGSDPKLPDLSRLDTYRPKQVTRILDRNGAAIGEMGSEKRTVVPYNAIPKLLVQAVVSAEDADYFKHGGLDYRGMARAFIEDVLRGRRAQGGSTITQQVVKNLVLSPERTMRRKVQEIILARQLSQKLSKEEVLGLYLNQIYYGHGRYGCEEAARYFFGKSVRDIDLAEAALLAGLPQSPERLSPRKHPDAAKTRQRYVLGQMAEHGYIDRATADRVAAEPIRLVREPASARGMAAEAVDIVAGVLADKLGEHAAVESGLTVTTTLDAHLQELARTSLERGLEDLDSRQGFRGPSGHLTGKALEKRHAELAHAHAKGVRDSEIVEGIVTRLEVDAGNPKGGRMFVDIGAPDGKEGMVDFTLETRYGKGPKPLASRFKEGDLARVRWAGDRPRPDEGGLPLALELGPQAAMVVMDPATHQVLALVGGYDFHPGGFDRSVRAQRQPGSAFKPIVYAAAVEAHKITPATMINDAPEVYDLWKPQNYEKEEFRGPVRVRTALAESINTVAIKVLSEVGIDQVRAVATRVGITSPIAPDVGLSLALGSLVVTPLELANAYATFADGGMAAKFEGSERASLVTAIGDQKLPAPQLQPGLPPDVDYVMVSLMRSVIDEGTARGAIAGKLHRPAAGKTGTSNGQRDAWFVGFTPDLLAAVWVGFDDMKKLGRGEAGGKTAAPIWADFMLKATAGKPTKDFTQPAGVVVQRIDKATGLLAAPGQESGTLDEVFLDGTAPTQQAAGAGQETNPDKLLLQ